MERRRRRAQGAVAHYRELLEIQVEETVDAYSVRLPRPDAEVLPGPERIDSFGDRHVNRIFLSFSEDAFTPKRDFLFREWSAPLARARMRMRVVCRYINII